MEEGRYIRQVTFFGEETQARVESALVVVVGCGGLGCTSAMLLARAGVGRLRIVDKDRVDIVNVHRQILFDEEDATKGIFKAEAARKRLLQANSGIVVEAVVDEFSARNAEDLCRGADVLVDGLDNFPSRFVLNDVAVKHGIPMVYGAAVGSYGLVMPVFPGKGPCLRCLLEEPPSGGVPTCREAGIIGPLPVLVASLQAVHVLRILAGRVQAEGVELLALDPWEGTTQAITVQRNEACPCCGQRRFEYLEAPHCV